MEARFSVLSGAASQREVRIVTENDAIEFNISEVGIDGQILASLRLRKSEARAIASALMGAAAEL
jgi:hypothetical protein